MGLFDQLAGAALGALAGQGGALAVAQKVLQVVEQQGGLHALLDKLQSGGLQEVVASWVSTGPNQPVTPDQLQNALGAPQVAQLAGAAGINPQELLGAMAQHLPALVNHLSPEGQLPAQLPNLLQAAIGMLTKG